MDFNTAEFESYDDICTLIFTIEGDKYYRIIMSELLCDILPLSCFIITLSLF